MKSFFKNTGSIILSLAMIFSLSSCLGGRNNGEETLSVAETDDIETEAVVTEKEKTPLEIYNEANEKNTDASALDVEYTIYFSAEADNGEKQSNTIEVRDKFLDTDEGKFRYESMTTTDANGITAVIQAYGNGIGYYSDNAVAVYSECTYDEYVKCRENNSTAIDNDDFGKYEMEEKDDGYVITYSQPSEDIFDFFLDLFYDSRMNFEGIEDETCEGSAVINSEGFITEEKFSFSAKLHINGQSLQFEVLMDMRVLTVNDESRVTINIPTDTSSYIKIDSLEGYFLINGVKNVGIASAKSNQNIELSYGSNDMKIVTTNEYLSSVENGVYTATLDTYGTANGVEADTHAEYDGKYMHISYGGLSQSNESDSVSAYDNLVSTLAPFGLDVEWLNRTELEEADGIRKVSVGFKEEYFVNLSYYFLSIYFANLEGADFSYVLSVDRVIKDAYAVVDFDEEDNIVSYTTFIDGEFTDQNGMITSVRVEVSVTDIILY